MTKTYQTMIAAMKECEQMPGLSVLEHGEMVRDYYFDLLTHLRTGAPLAKEWRLPEWAHSPMLLEQLLADDVMEQYLVHHDAGKPVCLTIDDDGKRHFPDHAAVSKRVWLECGGDVEVGNLIGLDMEVHLLKDEGVARFCERPQALSLLLAGLSEVHANASLFGGIESISFKMKWKHLDKRGKAILRHLSKAD